MSKVVSARQALEHIADGATVGILGSGGGVCEPTYLLKQLGEYYKETGAPRNLTLLHANGIGDKDTYGTDALAIKGLVKRDIAGHWAMAPKMAQLALDEKIEAYNLPQGVISQMYGTIASHKPGVITKTGLHTFIDPRLEGGRMNKRTTEDIVRVIELDGEEWLFYPNQKIDVALVRGTTADEHGNITYEEEASRLDGVSLAQAARNSGGIVIAQVKYLAEDGTLDPKDVVIPGIYVDYIVVDKDQKQTCITNYDAALAGNVRSPKSAFEKLPLDAKKVVARRAAKELPMDSVINLGVGMPAGVAAVAAEEGYIDRLNFTVEQGAIGGVPVGGIIFGVSYCPDALIDQTLQFNFYDGGGLDAAFLGVAQVDSHGNVNSSKTGRMLSGCGGAINISQNAKKVVFCGTFTAKGLKETVADGKLTIVQEGAIKEFVMDAGQITFSGKYALETKQPVLYVTERAVFELTEQGVCLKEIAPGVDLERDILGQMDFRPLIADDLKLMDAALFTE